ncbi:MAG: hypothetical protein ACPGQS_04815 [Bradymonadia bacterium]
MTTDHHFTPIHSEVYGVLSDGQTVKRFTLTRDRLSVSVLEYGAYIDRIALLEQLEFHEVNTGLSSLAAYEADDCARGSLVAPGIQLSDAPGAATSALRTPMTYSSSALHQELWSGREAVDQRGPCLEMELTLPGEASVDGIGRYIRLRLIMLERARCLVEYQLLADDVCQPNFAPSICVESRGVVNEGRGLEWSCEADGNSQLVSREAVDVQLDTMGQGERSHTTVVGSLYSIVAQPDPVTVTFVQAQSPLKLCTASSLFFIEEIESLDDGACSLRISPQPMIWANGAARLPDVEPGTLYRSWCEFEFDVI